MSKAQFKSSDIKADNSLRATMLKGAVIVLGDQVGAIKYALCNIDAQGKINYSIHKYISQKEFKEQIKDDDRFEESTLHLDGEWAGADDGLLRRVVYAKINQAAVDNAYRTLQALNSINRDIEGMRSKLNIQSSTGLATEHVIEPRIPSSFQELELLQIFKFISNEDVTTLAVKVGRSTAITGIALDENNNLINVSNIPADQIVERKKIRMRKHAMVVIIK